MEVPFDLLTLQEEAQRLLEIAIMEKRILENKKETIAIRTENSTDDAQTLQYEIASAQAELNSLDTYIASLPEGKVKEKQITKRIAIELRIRRLNESGTRLGAEAIVQQVFDNAQLQSQIDNLATFITALEARKAALQS